jgi:hypothetical protein
MTSLTDRAGFDESAVVSPSTGYSRAFEYAVVLAAFLVGLTSAIVFEKAVLSEASEQIPVALVSA